MRYAQVVAITCLFLWFEPIASEKPAHALFQEITNAADATTASKAAIRRMEFSHSLQETVANATPVAPPAVPSVTSSEQPPSSPSNSSTNLEVANERTIDLHILLPPHTTAAPIILVLGDLGSNPKACDYLMNHWAQQGLACIFLSHGDRIDTILAQAPLVNRISAYQSLGNTHTLHTRADDAARAISVLRQWSESPNHPLTGQFDWNRFGIVGHGFGASVTLQVLTDTTRMRPSSHSNVSTAGLLAPILPKAVCLLGPTPLSGEEQRELASLPCLPGLIISADLDESLIRRPDPLRRNHWFASYPDCADRFELRILDGRHFDFTSTPLRFGRANRNPNYHPLLQSITTTFFQAYLEADPAASEALVTPDLNPAIQSTIRWSRTLAKP
ncbi:Alpha/beta hydrolase family protein [Pirellula sp. SH-Sr6A]|uniref:alpha/beta hydrolase family protein n=1 Tax=Pirellula sp. SH-Sr6A TaxID=1632865 RepID=UPI00078EDB34|nr:hypothetical protein [Pirellula sp. SH-Sr6A]AMV31891.1 Alpha/beta hydrolase family protein [Pirellula sp. SH-Sr6A]